MQYPPDKTELLQAVAMFLAQEARPAVSDPATSFKLLVAAHLCQVVAAEIEHEDAHDAAELRGLIALLGGQGTLPPTRHERKRQIAALNAALAQRLREGASESEREEITAFLLATLRDRLAVSSPKFETAMRLPGEG